MGRPCRLAPGHEGFWVATGAFGLLSIVAFLARWLLRARGAPGGGEQGGGRCAGPKWRERQQGERVARPVDGAAHVPREVYFRCAGASPCDSLATAGS